MSSEALLLLLISYVLLHIKPGPGQAFRIGCALDKGFASAFSVTVGVSLMCAIFFVAVALSYNGLIAKFESLANLFKILGGAYLIYLGAKGFVKRKHAIETDTPAPSGKSLFKYFSLGIVLSLSNPMDIVYFLSVLPSLVPVGELSTLGLIQGSSIVFFTGIIIDILILGFVVQAKESFINSPLISPLNIIISIVFILIGVFFLVSALFMDGYALNLT